MFSDVNQCMKYKYNFLVLKINHALHSLILPNKSPPGSSNVLILIIDLQCARSTSDLHCCGAVATQPLTINVQVAGLSRGRLKEEEGAVFLRGERLVQQDT